MSTLKELEMERISPRLLEVLRRQGLSYLTQFQQNAVEGRIMQGRSQILVTHDFDEAYQIAEIALLNIVASDFRSKIVILCPNRHHVEKRLYSIGHKCRRLGIEVTSLTQKRHAIGREVRAGRVIIGTYSSLDIALRTNPQMFEGLQGVLVDRLDLIGQPGIGARLESVLVTVMGSEEDIQYVSICPSVEDLDELSSWMDAAIIEDPKEDIRRIYSVKDFSNMYDSLTELTEFVHFQRGQIIILCSNIDRCEKIAADLAGIGDEKHPKLDLRLTPEQRDDLREISSDVMKHFIKSELTTRLALHISRGVTFIHEGVSRSQRRVISSAWEEGVIPVMIMPTRFAIASGFRATVVFLIGVFTQEVGDDLSETTDLRMLSEWQLSDVLNSSGRRGHDNEAYGIVVVDKEIEKQRVIAKYFRTNRDGSISPILGEVDSLMDNPLNLQDLALVSLCGKGRRTESLFSVIDRTYWAAGHHMSRLSDSDLLPADDTSVDDLISMRATKATIKRAEEIPDKSVKLVSVTPTKIAGLIRSSSRELWHYVVLKSEEGVSCSCESWKYQGLRKHRLCKHLVKFADYSIDNVDSKPYALSVLRTALWGLEIVGELDKDDLLQPEGKTMRCTKMGSKVAMLGIPVKEARTILKEISNKNKNSKSMLSSIINTNRGLPKRIIQYVLDSVPVNRIEDLLIDGEVAPGIVENCIDEILYSLDMILTLEDGVLEKKVRKEFEKLQENIRSIVVSVS